MVHESFRVIRPNLLGVLGETDPDLSRMMQIGDGAGTATRTLDMEWLTCN